MVTEYWYIVLPEHAGRKVHGETVQQRINRELNALVGRGWHPVSIASSEPNATIGVMLRRETA